MNILKKTSILFVLSLISVNLSIGNNADAAGSLIISESHKAVYYHAEDGKRYVFPNDRTFFSWYEDFSSVTTITDEELYAIPLGGNVTYKPGKTLVKIQTDPKVYYVDQGSVLRWITSEQLAEFYYGKSWNSKVQDVPDVFFSNYTLGDPVEFTSDLNLEQLGAGIKNISQNKSIPATPAKPATPAISAEPAQPGNSATSTPAVPATPATPAYPVDSGTSTPPSEPEDATGPLITSLSISPTEISPGDEVTFTVIAEDPSGITNVVYDILYPDDGRYDGPFYIRPNCNFESATEGTCTFTESIDHASSPTILGDYTIVIRAGDAFGNVSTYYPDGTVEGGDVSTHTLDIPTITVSEPPPPATKTVIFADNRPQPFNSEWVDVSGYDKITITFVITDFIAGYDIHFTDDPDAGEVAGTDYRILTRVNCNWEPTCQIVTVPIAGKYYRVSTGTAEGNVDATGLLSNIIQSGEGKIVTFADRLPQPFNSEWHDVSGYDNITVTLSITNYIAQYAIHYSDDRDSYVEQTRVDCGNGPVCDIKTFPILGRYYRISTGTAAGDVTANGYLY